MATATMPALSGFCADPIIMKSIIDAVSSSLTMCDSEAKCVGLSTIPTREQGLITGMIGVHGSVSGFVTVNLADKVAMALVGGLLQDRFDHLTSQVIDGAGEITNLIAGGIKKGLAGSPWAFGNVTVPSVIIGQQYQIAYTKGLQYFSATFEHKTEEVLLYSERLLQVAISLIKL